MTRQLRQSKGKTGLVLANGGWVTYQHILCLSRSPRIDGLPYPDANPLPKYVTDVFVPPIAEQAEGDARIEVSPSQLSTATGMLTGSPDIHRRIRPRQQTPPRPHRRPSAKRPQIPRQPRRRAHAQRALELGDRTGQQEGHRDDGQKWPESVLFWRCLQTLKCENDLHRFTQIPPFPMS